MVVMVQEAQELICSALSQDHHEHHHNHEPDDHEHGQYPDFEFELPGCYQNWHWA
jgi:hypothetical protein